MAFRGVIAALNEYGGTGLTGILLTAEDCYKEIAKPSESDDIERCLAMDLTGFYFDQQMASFNNWPTNPNFAENRVLGRLEEAFARRGERKDAWENIVFKSWVPTIRQEYEDLSARYVLDVR